MNELMVFFRMKLDGASPKTSAYGKEIDSIVKQAKELGLDKRKNADADRGNLDAILHNTLGIVAFEPLSIMGDLQQAPSFIQNILGNTIKDASAGLKKGGLIKGLTGALRGATTGVTKGYQRAYAGVLGTGMRMNLNQN